MGEESRESSDVRNDARAVGALVFHFSGATKASQCCVINYVSAQRSKGGRGWPMLLAVEAVCRMEGVSMLYSAADLSQDGRMRDGSGIRVSAAAAHLRWGFTAISAAEWRQQG